MSCMPDLELVAVKTAEDPNDLAGLTLVDDDRAGLALPVEVPEGGPDKAQLVDVDGTARTPGDAGHPAPGVALDLADLVLEAPHVVARGGGSIHWAGVCPHAPKDGRDRQRQGRNFH